MRFLGLMLPWSRAPGTESIKSASSFRFDGGRAARGMIGLVGSLKQSAMYQTVPAYLGFVCAALSNSTSPGRGVFGFSIFFGGTNHSGGAPRAKHTRLTRYSLGTLPLSEVGWVAYSLIRTWLARPN